MIQMVMVLGSLVCTSTNEHDVSDVRKNYGESEREIQRGSIDRKRSE